MVLDQMQAIGLTEEQIAAVMQMYEQVMGRGMRKEEGEKLGYGGGADYEARIQELMEALENERFERAVERGIILANAKNWRAVRSLLRTDMLRLNEDGTVLGLEEELMRLKESDGYLFKDEAEKRTFGTGGAGNFPRVLGIGRKNPWAEETFNLTEQGKLMREQPELARRFMRQAGI